MALFRLRGHRLEVDVETMFPRLLPSKVPDRFFHPGPRESPAWWEWAFFLPWDL